MCIISLSSTVVTDRTVVTQGEARAARFQLVLVGCTAPQHAPQPPRAQRRARISDLGWLIRFDPVPPPVRTIITQPQPAVGRAPGVDQAWDQAEPNRNQETGPSHSSVKARFFAWSSVPWLPLRSIGYEPFLLSSDTCRVTNQDARRAQAPSDQQGALPPINMRRDGREIGAAGTVH